MVTEATPGDSVTLGSEELSLIWRVSRGELSQIPSSAIRSERGKVL